MTNQSSENPVPPSNNASEISQGETLNAGLNLILLFSQAYYKMLESCIGCSCHALDLNLNEYYLWIIKNIRSMLDRNPYLSDFPISFEPIVPDLYPSTISDLEWEYMVAPDVERFLGAVQKYVMDKSVYPPEERSPAWYCIELFKASITSSIEYGENYRKRMSIPVNAPTARAGRRSALQAESSFFISSGVKISGALSVSANDPVFSAAVGFSAFR